MTQFNERERAFEKKFEIDEDFNFRVASRAAKELGQWAATQLGLNGGEADAYAQSALEADLRNPRHADLVNKIERDFRVKALTISRLEIAGQLELALVNARAALMQA